MTLAFEATRADHHGMEVVAATTTATRSLPCHRGDPDLWFAESPAALDRAKALCADCPVRTWCLDAALERAEPWGVWGGEIFDQGRIIARKRSRGRPRKNAPSEGGA